MSTLPLLVCALLAATPPVQRTPPVKDPVARVVALKGAVTAKTAGNAPIVVSVGTYFDADDTLEVGAGAWAAVVLRNEHVVRLDDDVQLKLSEVALFNAAKASVDLQAQLNRLLQPDERKNANAERLIGWHAGLVAANTAKKEEEQAQDAPSRPAAPRPPAEPPASPPPPPRAQAPAGPPATESRSEPSGSSKPKEASANAGEGGSAPGSFGTRSKDSGGGGSSNGTAQRLTMKKKSADDEREEKLDLKAPRDESPKPARRAARDEALSLTPDEALRACLAQELGALYPEYVATLKDVTVVITARGSAEPLVRLQGGLAAPACARAWVVARKQLLPAGKKELVVPLSAQPLGTVPGKR